jgi:enoyl-CoA hydratase
MLPKLTFRDEFAIMKFNRPDAMNALNNAVIDEIDIIVNDVRQSDAKAFIIIGGGEKAFCAGADIKEILDLSLPEKKAKAEKGQSIFAKIDNLDIPSFACINGYAFGGGLEISLACTFRVATKNAAVGLPEIKLGLLPGYGGTQRLPKVIGEARALEMIMSGRTLKADEALQFGLVNRILENDPLEETIEYAKEFTQYSKSTLGYAKTAIKRGLDTSLQDGLKIEADVSTLAYMSKDAQEGITAFNEKRKPNFRDC